MFTAPVMDAGPDAPLPWLVTVFVDGPSLAQAVAGHGPLPAASVLALAAGLAEGLGAVHAAGMVHRDLKPSNVLLARDGPRVIDFGIAQAVNATQMTGTGMVIGSPGFMSPEQAQGHPVGPASDVFSLGAVLVFAATGQGPFGDGTAVAQLFRVVHGTPRLDELPGPVRPLAERCLARDPGQRPSAVQFLAELTAAHPAAANLTSWLPESILAVIPPAAAASGHAAGPAAPGPGPQAHGPAGAPVRARSPDGASSDLSAPEGAWPSTVTAAPQHDLPGSAGVSERPARAEQPDQAAAAAGPRSAGLSPARVIRRRLRRSWPVVAAVAVVVAVTVGLLTQTGGVPQYTNVADSSANTSFTVPHSWHQISPSSLAAELKAEGLNSEAGWVVAYEAGPHPAASDFVSFKNTEPFVYAEIGQLTSTATKKLTYNTLRDFFLPVTSTARSEAGNSFPLTGFKQIRDQILTPGDEGVHGVRETFDYTFGGSAATFDEVVLTNAQQTEAYFLMVHCTTACYSHNQAQINAVMSSFTVGSPPP